jgi:hypothetical protein
MRLHAIAIVGRLHSENLFAIAGPIVGGIFYRNGKCPWIVGTLDREANETTTGLVA